MFSTFFKFWKVTMPVTLILAMILVLFFSPFATNQAGYRTVVQTFSGEMSVRFEPGFYMPGFFSKTTVYPDVITVQYGTEEEEGDDVTFFAPPHGVKFNGGDDARIGHTVKWDMPDDEISMLGIHSHYRTHKRLANTTLSQYQSETAAYSAQTLDSETHYSGGQSQLKEVFQDQLRNGQMLLDKNIVVIIDSLTGKTATAIEVTPKLDDKGMVIRTASDIQKYNIKPSFVSIDHVKYDPLIETKLKAKIESATVKSISEQELITAQQQSLTAIENGKKKIEEVKATKEAEKLEAVIDAQREAAVAKERALQAKYNAEKTVANGRAEAEIARLKVAAGLSPLDAARFKKETAIGVAEALAKRPVPLIDNSGSGANGNSLEAAHSMNQMLILVDKLKEQQE